MNKIGIIGAEQKEISLLKTQFIGKKIEIAGLTFFDGIINNIHITLVCAGIGKVNAAMCAQILISEFKVTSIINTGTAGGLDKNLNIFDIIVSTDLVQHDVDATHFGYPSGQIPQTPSPFWESDTSLQNKALEAFQKIKKEQINISSKIVKGRIASGDKFIADDKSRDYIIQHFHPQCTEMEGAAIGQVCNLNKIPFVILRSISDNAGKTSNTVISYEEFSQKASNMVSKLVLEILNMIE